VKRAAAERLALARTSALSKHPLKNPASDGGNVLEGEQPPG
jgi:hypothetical protein